MKLASRLVADGFQGKYDVAVVVSNDSDLCEPVRIVKDELGKPVGVANPHQSRYPAILRASFYRPIRSSHLSQSQLPATITDGAGSFGKPAGW